MTEPLLWSVSVVSHRQGSLVSGLLDDLERHSPEGIEVLVVINVPEDERFLDAPRPYPVRVLRNTSPRGFGANHNAAFRESRGSAFVVANPDIRLLENPFVCLKETLAQPAVGICSPSVLSATGTVEDHARRFPTFYRLIRRRLGPVPLDYDIRDVPLEVDWVAGMFIACRRETFELLGGFDERYFMYFEDVDLCQRAAQRQLKVVVDPRTSVVHDARRSSHRNPRYFYWHVRSAVRYLLPVI